MKRYQKSLFLNASIITLMALGSTSAMAQSWTDHVAIEGSMTITSPDAQTTNIQQHTDFTKVQGNASIAAGHTVNLNQPNSASKYVVYDTSADPTQILGSLNANGQVFIFDQNGVIFGADSRVDVGSIIATTGTISDAQLKSNSGHYVIENIQDGSVVNHGSITASESGLVGLVAPHVANHGVIKAKMGKVAMAAGDRVTLDLHGDQLIEIALSDATQAALIENTGTINAEGGYIAIKAQAARGLVDDVINMGGITNASSVTQNGGKIVLDGGNAGSVRITGTMKADGHTGGGNIDVKAQQLKTERQALITANATNTGNGGNIITIAKNLNESHAKLESKGGDQSGNGGFIEVSGKHIDVSSAVDTSATNGKFGTFLIDPEVIEIILGKGTNVTGGNIDKIYEEWLVSQLTSISLQAEESIIFKDAEVAWGAGEDLDGDASIITLMEGTSLSLYIAGTGSDNNPSIPNGIHMNTTSYGNDLTLSLKNGNFSAHSSATDAANNSSFVLSNIKIESDGVDYDVGGLIIYNMHGNTNIAGSVDVAYLNITQENGLLTINDVNITPILGLPVEESIITLMNGALEQNSGSIFSTNQIIKFNIDDSTVDMSGALLSNAGTGDFRFLINNSNSNFDIATDSNSNYQFETINGNTSITASNGTLLGESISFFSFDNSVLNINSDIVSNNLTSISRQNSNINYHGPKIVTRDHAHFISEDSGSHSIISAIDIQTAC